MAGNGNIRYLGNFESIQEVWAALPGGGQQGDYITINGNTFSWNKYIRQWQNSSTVVVTPTRETKTHDGDYNVGNNIRVGGDLIVIGKIINDSIKNGKSAYEVWLEQEGNAGKTVQEFLASLKESGFTTQAVTTRPTASNADANTIYAVPDKSDEELEEPDIWREWICVDGVWKLLATHDGSGLSSALADIVDLKDGLYSGFNPNRHLTQGGFNPSVGSVLETWVSSTNVMAILKTPVRVSCNEGYYIRQIAGLDYDNIVLASIYNNQDGISEYFIPDDTYKRVAIQFKKAGGVDISPSENVFKTDSGYTGLNENLQQISADVEDCTDALDGIKDVVTDVDEWIPKSPSTATSSISADSMIQGGISLKYDGSTVITGIPMSQMITSATDRIYTKINFNTFQSIRFIDNADDVAYKYLIRCADANDNFLGNANNGVSTKQETTRQTIENLSFSENIKFLYVVVIPDDSGDITPTELLELTTTQQVIKPFAESVEEAIEDYVEIAQDAKDKADTIDEWIPKFQAPLSENIPATGMTQGSVGSGNTSNNTPISSLISSNSKRIYVRIDFDESFKEVCFTDNINQEGDDVTYSYFGRFADSDGIYIGDFDSSASKLPMSRTILEQKSYGSRISYFYVIIKRDDNEEIAPSELLKLTTLQPVTKSFGDSVKEVIGSSSTLKTYPLPLEYGGLNQDGTIETVEQRATFFSKKRTPNFIKLVPFTLALSGCTAKIYLYDYEFNLVQSVSYNAETFNADDYIGLCSYFKVALSLAADVTDIDDTSSVVFTATSYDEVKNKYTSLDEISFTYQVHTCCGRDVTESDVTIEQLPEQKYYNSGLLRLPINYVQFGKPSKLILYAHASGQYQKITAVAMSTHNETYPNGKYTPFFEYLQKEGYAIFDCFAVSSKYSNEAAFEDGALASPTNMSCIINAYEWVVSHYNIDTNGIYVFGKSLGGIVCAAMLFQHSIPVKAVVPLAPQLEPIFIQFGYQANTRAMYVDDTGLDPEVTIDGTTYTILGTSNGENTKMNDEAFAALCVNNANLLTGVVPTLRNIIQPSILDIVSVRLKNQGNLNVKRLCSVPLKIFISADDENVSYQASVNFVNSIKATGGLAEIRRMPDHTGKHHAVDKTEAAKVEADGEALVVNPTTALGYQCTDIPLAWVEMVEFFRRF